MINYEYDRIRPIGEYLAKPSSTLYNDLLALKRDSYDPNYRIVFSHFELMSNIIVSDFIAYLQKSITFLDIPNFFVVIVSNDRNIVPMLEDARQHYSNEDIAIGFEYVMQPRTEYRGDFVAFFNPPDTVCAQPWISLDINSQGEFKPCCFYKDSIKDNNGIPFRADKDSFETVYNSDSMKQLRYDFLMGKKPEPCTRCWKEEEDNTISKRQLLKHRFKPLGYTTNWEEDDISNLLYVGVAFGNICNLKCRICSHTNSSQIATENLIPIQDKKSHPAYKSLKDGMWIKNDTASVWDNLLDPNLKFIHLDISGGEPMLSDKHFSVLQQLVDNGRAKDITLHYNTNGTIFPAEHIELLKQFKLVDIALSIDNLGQQFEYERSGGVWAEVSNNIDSFLSINHPNIKTAIHLAINIQNVYYLPEINDWINSKNFDSVHFSTLYFPEYLNISNVTEHARDLILDKLQKYNNPNQFIINTINILKAAKLSDGVEFCDYMQSLDRIRNESFLHSHPEVSIAMGYSNNNQLTLPLHLTTL